MRFTQARARIDALVETLQLEPMPGEAGRFNLLLRSKLPTVFNGKETRACNGIYYLLTAEDPQNHLHWLACDDTEMLLEGGPYQRYAFHADGTLVHQTIGRDLQEGQRPIFHAPGGTGKAARLDPGVDYALIGSVVAPAWQREHLRIGGGPGFIERFAGKADWATESFLRELIGPNWDATL